MSSTSSVPIVYTPTDWEGMWQQGIAPGERFDISEPHKALLHHLPRLPEGRALVPGCGRGYDLAALATADRHVTGLDLAPTSTAAAAEYLKGAVPAALQGQYALVTGDAFAFEGKFDLVYDHTFLCALPPTMRSQWAAKMAGWVRPGGTLLTLQFPLGHYGQIHPAGKPLDYTVGPPYLLSKELYHTLLDAAFECVEEVHLPPELNAPRREGVEAIAEWRRRAE